jgi:DNA-binding transcriptional LysR family regulator
MSSGFEDLRAFLAVADEGSFLSAATKLGVSRTTLRRQVDALEAQAGVPLLQRATQGVELTEAGKRLVGTGRAMEREFSALLHAVRETGRRPEGEVRMLIEIGLPPGPMAVIFGLCRSSWPRLTIRTRFAESPLSSLSEVDVVIWFGDSDPGSAWETYTFQTVRQRLFASASYLQERGTPRTIEDLANHDLLAWTPSSQKETRITTMAGRSHVIRPILTSTNVDFLHECARMGLGIAWAPDAGLPPPQGFEATIPVLENLVEGETTLRLAVPRVLADVPKVRVFIENLQVMRDAVEGAA